MRLNFDFLGTLEPCVGYTMTVPIPNMMRDDAKNICDITRTDPVHLSPECHSYDLTHNTFKCKFQPKTSRQ